MATIHKQTVTLPFTGSDGSATAGGSKGRISFGRPGILRAVKFDLTGQPAGTDGTIKDETGNTIITFTNVGNTTVLGSVVVDGVTDDGAAATDLAQGAPFRSGLQIDFTSGDGALDPASTTDDAAAIVTVWVEV